MAEPDVRLNLTALPLADAARLLSAASGQRVTVEMLRADVAVSAALFVGGQEAKPVVTAAHPRGSRPAGADELELAVASGQESGPAKPARTTPRAIQARVTATPPG